MWIKRLKILMVFILFMTTSCVPLIVNTIKKHGEEDHFKKKIREFNENKKKEQLCQKKFVQK